MIITKKQYPTLCRMIQGITEVLTKDSWRYPSPESYELPDSFNPMELEQVLNELADEAGDLSWFELSSLIKVLMKPEMLSAREALIYFHST